MIWLRIKFALWWLASRRHRALHRYAMRLRATPTRPVHKGDPTK